MSTAPNKNDKPTHRRKRVIGEGWAYYAVFDGVVWCLAQEGNWFTSSAPLELFEQSVKDGEMEALKEEEKDAL